MGREHTLPFNAMPAAVLRPCAPPCCHAGMDQDNTVQRTMLSVLRRLAVACPAALPPHWKELVPSICAIVQVGFGCCVRIAVFDGSADQTGAVERPPGVCNSSGPPLIKCANPPTWPHTC